MGASRHIQARWREALQRQTKSLASRQSQMAKGNRVMDITWITQRIALGGGIWNAENMAEIARAGITHIIDMQLEFDDTPLAQPYAIEVLWNPTDEDFQPKPAELFDRGVDFASAALDAGESKVFIHCAAGVHRAQMMTLAVLCSQGWDLQDAIKAITSRRPVADFAEVSVMRV